MPSLSLKSACLRKAKSHPALRLLDSTKLGDSNVFPLAENMPGINFAKQPSFLGRDPQAGLLSPVSPMFELELETNKVPKSSSVLEKCQSELSLCGGVIGSEDNQLHQLLSLFRNTCSVSAQLSKQLYRHLSSAASTSNNSSQQQSWASTGSSSSVDIEAIAKELLAGGYLVQLRDEAQQERSKDVRNCLQNLRHRFLVCLGYRPMGDGEPVYLSEPVVVEPRFREQFAIAHPTAAYEATLQAVPPCFVGPVHRLEAVVKLLCQEMTSAFKSQGLPVPPWRTRQAMLSKWAPAQLAQLAEKIAMMRRMSADLAHSGVPVTGAASNHGELCNGARPAAAHATHHAAVGSAPACPGDGPSATATAIANTNAATAAAVAAAGSSGGSPAADAMHAVALAVEQLPVDVSELSNSAARAVLDSWATQLAVQRPVGFTERMMVAAAPAGPVEDQTCASGSGGRVQLQVPIQAIASPLLGGAAVAAAPFVVVAPPVPDGVVQLDGGPFAAASGQDVVESSDPGNGWGLSMGSAIRFTRKASAEWRQRKGGKKMKGLLAVALNRAAVSGSKATEGTSSEAALRSKNIRTTGDEPWSRITTVRWGAAYTPPAAAAGTEANVD